MTDPVNTVSAANQNSGSAAATPTWRQRWQRVRGAALFAAAALMVIWMPRDRKKCMKSSCRRQPESFWMAPGELILISISKKTLRRQPAALTCAPGQRGRTKRWKWRRIRPDSITFWCAVTGAAAIIHCKCSWNRFLKSLRKRPRWTLNSTVFFGNPNIFSLADTFSISPYGDRCFRLNIKTAPSQKYSFIKEINFLLFRVNEFVCYSS